MSVWEKEKEEKILSCFVVYKKTMSFRVKEEEIIFFL